MFLFLNHNNVEFKEKLKNNKKTPKIKKNNSGLKKYSLTLKIVFIPSPLKKSIAQIKKNDDIKDNPIVEMIFLTNKSWKIDKRIVRNKNNPKNNQYKNLKLSFDSSISKKKVLLKNSITSKESYFRNHQSDSSNIEIYNFKNNTMLVKIIINRKK